MRIKLAVYQGVGVAVAVVFMVCMLGGCSILQLSPWDPPGNDGTGANRGYVYRPAESGVGTYVTLYFPVLGHDSLLVPVTRRVENGQAVQLVYAAIAELLAGPAEGSGLSPVLVTGGSIAVSGVSVEDNNAYLVLSGARPTTELLEHIHRTLAAQGYEVVQVFWEQEFITELAAGTDGRLPINVQADRASLQVFLPIAIQTEESYRLYVVSAMIDEVETPSAAVGYVLSAVCEEENILKETALAKLVPKLFTKSALLPSVRVEGPTAIVDFPSETVALYHGGPAGEAALLDALTLTLTNFAAIERVEFTVAGATVSQLFTPEPIRTVRERPRQLNPE